MEPMKTLIQVLCKACHFKACLLIKTSTEHGTGQYIKINDTESLFNIKMTTINKVINYIIVSRQLH
jgi:ABC-type transporter lipoprotein component MlaA